MPHAFGHHTIYYAVNKIEAIQRGYKGVQRYGVSCTAQLSSPAQPREEAPQCRLYFNF